MTLNEAKTAHAMAQAALTKLAADIVRATAAEQGAMVPFQKLKDQRDSGAFDDASKLAEELKAARTAHDLASAHTADLIAMEPILVKREAAAREAMKVAKQRDAKPKTDALEAESKKAFEAWCKVHRASLDFRKEHDLACTGAFASFDQQGKGLQSILAAYGIPAFVPRFEDQS